jgi:uncharacterized membrane protein
MIHSAMGGLHAVAALAAILLGLAVILLPKGRALHRLLGLTYVFSMLTTSISALLLYGMTGHFGLFHFFALVSLISVIAGLIQPIFRRPDWMRRHLIWLAWSYLGLLAAAATEAAIRLPMLKHLANGETFLLGGAIGVAAMVIGWSMMPHWTRKALANVGMPTSRN